ncbi:MAG: YafY family transcriptional regulator [Streptosporangiales bacterium]|nr:YafY family transcriptional regulator [Streptosporangiales bacterium]MBO0889847.1 YafY family transcriptional regulator [Acidothermales bacterium]
MLATSARLLRLLSLLQTRRDWSGQELAGRLEVDVRTVRRDVDRLRSLGYPVHSASGVAGGYRLESGADVPPLLLDDEEAVAVAVGLRSAAGGTVAGIEESSVRALAKLEQVLPSRLRHRVDALQSAVVPLLGGAPTVDAGLLTAVAAAVRDHVRLRFDYRSHGGETSRRLVEPLRLVHTGRRWYLVGWDVDRDDWRTYRVDRVEGTPSTRQRFTPREPPAADIAAYVSDAVANAPYRYHVTARLHAPAEAMAPRVSPTSAVLEAVDERTCLLRVGVPSLPLVPLYLAQLDVEFEVVDPPELVEHVRAVADRLRRAAP